MGPEVPLYTFGRVAVDAKRLENRERVLILFCSVLCNFGHKLRGGATYGDISATQLIAPHRTSRLDY